MIEQPSGTGVRPLQAEFSRFLADLALHKGHQGYHLTMVYKDAQTARAADRNLKHAFPRILNRVVSGNWIRAAEKGNLVAFGFLDTPGSRRSSLRARVSIASAQDDYHHHCILLLEPSKARKIDRLARSSSIEMEADPAHSPFRRKMVRSGERVLRELRGMLAANEIVRGLPLRSLKIQRLPDQEDIERATNYAAKSLDRLSEHFPDEAYSVLTKQRERPIRSRWPSDSANSDGTVG